MRERQLNTQQVQLTTWASIDRFQEVEDVPQGYLVVKHDDVPIDLFYKSKGADTTVVCFHGAVEKDIRLPWHVGGGVLRDVEANRLSISDPTLHLFEEVQIGWFAGNDRMPTLLDDLTRVVRTLVEKTGTKHIIFFGSSAGGFAALAMSYRFPGSLALPMNPQTSIHKFYERPVGRYLEHAWAGIASLDNTPGPITHDLTKVYDYAHQNTVAFIQNSRDAFHIKHHQEPFYEVTNPSRTWTLWGAWGTEKDNGHVTPPKDVTAKVLQEVSGSGGRWDEALEISGFTPAAY